ncbi:MAG: hypothetical protein H6586_04295 [Flavobacteriales bacterium]|nr:hypothetical protein [Flavobacteriales bacterium]
MRQLAIFFSFVFHPLLIPALGLIIVFNSNSYVNYAIPLELKQATLLLVTVTTFVIPSLITLLLLHRNMISSIEMPTSKERILPYGFTIVFYILTIYLLKRAPIPQIIFDFMIGALISVFSAFFINLKWKISAHMIGIGGLSSALICMAFVLNTDLFLFVVLAFFASGLVASSRLFLEAHTPKQLIAGYILGASCQIFAIYF